MSVKDWASMDRWLLVKRCGAWFLDAPRDGRTLMGSWHPTFSEAHATYLDAVTCEAVSPFLNYSDPRCARSRGHKGPHRFATPVGLMPLVVNQK